MLSRLTFNKERNWHDPRKWKLQTFVPPSRRSDPPFIWGWGGCLCKKCEITSLSDLLFARKDDIAVKYGDDGTDEYKALAAAGAFEEFTSQKIFEESGKGLLAWRTWSQNEVCLRVCVTNCCLFPTARCISSKNWWHMPGLCQKSPKKVWRISIWARHKAAICRKWRESADLKTAI